MNVSCPEEFALRYLETACGYLGTLSSKDAFFCGGRRLCTTVVLADSLNNYSERSALVQCNVSDW